jgi:DNA polymerase I-like protein with 3'-5' exonuclease and polymerase domains
MEQRARDLGMTEDRDIYEYTWGSLNQEMIDYCVLDTEVTLKLYQKCMKANPTAMSVWLETRFAHILQQQEEYGFGFDREAASALYAKLVGRRLELRESLSRAFPGRYEGIETKAFKRTARFWRVHPLGAHSRYRKKTGWQSGFDEVQEAGHEFTRIEWVEFNPSSRQQIAKRLQEKGWEPLEFTDSGQPKIDETILEKLPYPEAQVLAEYFTVEKRIGQIAEGDQAWLRLERNGRIHGSVNTNGAVTGRCTHSNPNVAQVPKVGSPYGSDCRSLFRSTLGTLVGADLSGLELRCLAHFMARYDEGEYGRVLLEGDIHWANVQALGLTEEDRNDSLLIHKLFRDAAKTFVYAFLYGAGDLKIGTTIFEKVIIAARKEGYEGWQELQQKFFGTRGTPTEADLTAAGKRLKNTFMNKTPALKALKKAVTEKAKQGTIRGMDGRELTIRSPHSALNTLLQSAGALIAKLATVLAYDEASTRGMIFGKDWALVAHIHDEMQTDCKREIADEVGGMLVRGMQNAGRMFSFRVPIDGEYKLGRNWCETH